MRESFGREFGVHKVQAFEGGFCAGWRPAHVIHDCPAVYLASTCPRSRVPCRPFVVYPGVLSLQATGCPSRVRHTLRFANRASSPIPFALLYERGQNMEAPRLLAQFWVSAQGIGSREVWPRYAFCEAYRVAPAT